MDYSNESFEIFQKALAERFNPDDLFWLLRDGLFTQAYYDYDKKGKIALDITYGDILYLINKKIFRKRNKIKPDLDIVDTCVILPSKRSNHIGRLIPYIEGHASTYGVFTTTPFKEKFLDSHQILWINDATGEWIDKLRVHHYKNSKKYISQSLDKIPLKFNRRQKYLMSLYLCQFSAWKEIWDDYLSICKPKKIISTFECSPPLKALFYSASNLKIPSRIHWYGGMRHSMLQSTLATELWCQTQSDARFFKGKLPGYCTAKFMENPECMRIAEKIGVLGNEVLTQTPVRFLFLGPGANPLYSNELRMRDLGVVRKIRDRFGDQIVWRMRPHPSRIDRFVGELNEAGIHNIDISTRPLYEDIEWAHAVGTATSSLLLDLVKTGRKLFWIQHNLRSISSVDEHVADGIGMHLGSADGTLRLAGEFPQLV